VARRRTRTATRRTDGRVCAAERAVYQGANARVQSVRVVATVPARRAIHRRLFRRSGPEATAGTGRGAVPVGGPSRVQQRPCRVFGQRGGFRARRPGCVVDIGRGHRAHVRRPPAHRRAAEDLGL